MKKRIIIYAVIVTLLLCLLFSSIYAFMTLGKKQTIESESTTTNPVITEEFNSVTSKLLKKYDGSVYYDKDTKEIYEVLDYNEKYILGTSGKLYPNKIKYISSEEDNDEILTFDRYKIYKDDSGKTDRLYYYYDKLNKKESSSYLYITPIYYNNNPRYLFLEGNNRVLDLIDIKTHKKVTLNKDISMLPEFASELYGYQVKTNNEYNIVAINTNNKYGVIDSDGNVIIDFIYDKLITYKNNLYIAKMNDKYGIIDSKNKTVLNFEYDTLSCSGNYIIVTKDYKLGVLNNKYKTIVNYTIDVDKTIEFYNVPNNDMHGIYSVTNENNSLLLMVYPYGYMFDEGANYVKKNDNIGDIKSYIISSRGIDRSFTVQTNIEPLYTEDDNYNSVKYYYSVSDLNGKAVITFYDTDYYEYYKYTTQKLINSEYYVSIMLHNNIAQIDISYGASDENNFIYIDLFNSKEIKEIDALYKVFDNGYGYVLNDNTLSIYKNKELLNKFNNINEYLGGYLFSTKDNSIIEIEFQKDK